MQTNSGLLLEQDQVFDRNLHQLQQSTFETAIQVILFLLVAWYLFANLLGESINLPQLSISLIPAVIGSWLAMKWLSERLEAALSIWMIGLAAMMGIAGFFSQRPELLLILLPLSTIGVLVVNWWYGVIVVAVLFIEAWLLGGTLSIGLSTPTDLQIILLGGLIGVIVGWAISRSLLVASSWAVDGYLKAQIEMDEARKNRMELKQIQDDLLHANYELARLTERLKVLHQVAEEARHVKEQFVSNVSHELRTPLNMIISFSEMIMQSLRTNGVQLPSELMAESTIIALPIILLFFLARRTFIEGISLTGLKG